jgi:hypothetical protein
MGGASQFQVGPQVPARRWVWARSRPCSASDSGFPRAQLLKLVSKGLGIGGTFWGYILFFLVECFHLDEIFKKLI